MTTDYFPNIRKYPVAHEKIDIRVQIDWGIIFFVGTLPDTSHNLLWDTNYPYTKYFTKITNRVRLSYIEGKGVDICINTYKDTNTNTSL